MTVPIAELLKRSREVAREYDNGLTVEGITSADGGTGRAELLVTISGCHRDPCVVLLNLDRTDEATVESQLRAKLLGALANHRSASREIHSLPTESPD